MSAQLLKGVGHQDYHSDNFVGSPRLSRSIATLLLNESPLRAWSRHPRLGGVPEDEEALSPQQLAARDRGSALHTLLADGAGPGIALIPFSDWRKDAAKNAREEARAAGLLPILEHKYAELQEATSRIRESLRRYGIELGGFESEVTALWESNGVTKKARLDKLSLAVGMIYDFKTVDRISRKRFEWSIETDGLHIQQATNVEGVTEAKPALAGRVGMAFLQVEVRPPFDCAIFELAPAYVDLGEQAWRRMQAKWKELMERYGAGTPWPGYGRQAPIEPRPFQLEKEFTEQLSATGEPAWSKEE